MAQAPEYFVVRRNADGSFRYYWRAGLGLADRLAGSGFKPLVRLSDDRAEAERQCRDLTAQVRANLGGAPACAARGRWMGEHKERLHAAVRLVQPVLMKWAPFGVTRQHVGVYVLRAENGRIKVGRAERPLKRIERLSTGAAGALWLVFFIRLPEAVAGAVEERAHLILTDHHVTGEWFEVSPALAIAAVLEAVAQITG